MWTFKADIAFFIFAWIFRISGPKMAIFRSKIGEKVGRYWPQRTRSYFLGLHLCVKFGENRQRNATVRVTTHGQTHRQTDANRFYYLFHAICYSYRADNEDKICVQTADRHFHYLFADSCHSVNCSGQNIAKFIPIAAMSDFGGNLPQFWDLELHADFILRMYEVELCVYR